MRRALYLVISVSLALVLLLHLLTDGRPVLWGLGLVIAGHRESDGGRQTLEDSKYLLGVGKADITGQVLKSWLLAFTDL